LRIGAAAGRAAGSVDRSGHSRIHRAFARVGEEALQRQAKATRPAIAIRHGNAGFPAG
jgi:hypothetical protein